MTTAIYNISDVRIFVAGHEVGLGDLVLKVEEHIKTLEISPQKIPKPNPQMATYAQALKAEPMATYIGDHGFGKKTAQWKQEQRRFRK